MATRSFRSFCLPAVRFVGFWTAVLLPFILVSLFASGLAVRFPNLVGVLLACNVVGLVLGREYNR